MKKLLLILIATVIFTGCSSIRVMKSNVMVSTKSIQGVKVVAPVDDEYCNYMIMGFPIISDPRDSYEALMEKATEAGGNTVIDFQVRNKDVMFVYPFYAQSCWESTGHAAVIE